MKLQFKVIDINYQLFIINISIISETLISLICTERLIYRLSNDKHLDHITVNQDVNYSTSKKMVRFDQIILIIT